MSVRRLRPRAAALLAGGAFALHQLRYLLGYGDHAHGELGAQGHSYMTVAAPVVAVALMLVMADFGARLLRGHAETAAARTPLRRLWLLATLSLLAAYGIQESLEGALAPGHPAGAAALVAHGGWAALPLAAALGLAIALLARGARRAVELAAEPPVRVARPRPLVAVPVFALWGTRAGRGIARHRLARGPPLPVTP
jgi:hypothetical protein